MWVRSYKDSLDIVGGQFTHITLHSSHRSKELILSSSVSVKVQSSELYKKMLSTYALKIRGRMISLTCLLLNMFSSVSRLSIASFVSDKEPSSLHFFSSCYDSRRFCLFRICLFQWLFLPKI